MMIIISNMKDNVTALKILNILSIFGKQPVALCFLSTFPWCVQIN